MFDDNVWDIFCIEPFRHPKVFNLFENLRFARFSALSRRYFFTLWLYMPRHPTLGMATPSIILIPVVEGIGPCPPACDRQSPAPPPSTTFACTHRDAPGRSHFASDPCLSLRLYELDEPPFFLRFRLVQIAQKFIIIIRVDRSYLAPGNFGSVLER